MTIFYVYMMETTSKKGTKKYYTGYTNNLFRRWKEHRSGRGAKFCRGKEVELKYFETYLNRGEAMQRELEIKSLRREQKEDLIKNFQQEADLTIE